VPSTRERALDAAVELVGTEGLRSLTHARVDHRAALPRGSTSNYFRTRSALLTGVVDWIVEQELSQVGAAVSVDSAASFGDSLVQLLEYVTRHSREMTAARLVLFMEASHDLALREAVSRGRADMEASMIGVLERLGSSDPAAGAAALMATLEGLILHRIVRHDDSDPRPVLELVMRAALQ
jgi:DNA-binding transcriptional regulator YbjK